MPALGDSYPALVAALAERYGRPEPAIGDGGLPAILGAFLGRTLGPERVEAVLEGLREAGLLEPSALADADRAELDEAIGSSGGLGAKALGPLQRLARWVAGRGDLAGAATETLREELVGLNGVGPAAADAVLLEGLGRPVYPVARATYRILVRHGWIDPTADYDEARAAVEHAGPRDAAGLARLASWWERVGRDYCRPGRPHCERCPLQPFLPGGGPIEPDA